MTWRTVKATKNGGLGQNHPLRVNFHILLLRFNTGQRLTFCPEFHADLSRYKEIRTHCTRYKKLPPLSPPFCTPLAQGAKILARDLTSAYTRLQNFYPDPLRFAGVIRHIIPSRCIESVCTVGSYADKNIKLLLILSKYICMTA